jgi:hypothetical protein
MGWAIGVIGRSRQLSPAFLVGALRKKGVVLRATGNLFGVGVLSVSGALGEQTWLGFGWVEDA